MTDDRRPVVTIAYLCFSCWYINDQPLKKGKNHLIPGGIYKECHSPLLPVVSQSELENVQSRSNEYRKQLRKYFKEVERLERISKLCRNERDTLDRMWELSESKFAAQTEDVEELQHELIDLQTKYKTLRREVQTLAMEPHNCGEFYPPKGVVFVSDLKDILREKLNE